MRYTKYNTIFTNQPQVLVLLLDNDSNFYLSKGNKIDDDDEMNEGTSIFANFPVRLLYFNVIVVTITSQS